MGGGGKSGGAPPPPPPPPQAKDPEAQNTAAKARMIMRKRQGRAATNLRGRDEPDATLGGSAGAPPATGERTGRETLG